MTAAAELKSYEQISKIDGKKRILLSLRLDHQRNCNILELWIPDQVEPAIEIASCLDLMAQKIRDYHSFREQSSLLERQEKLMAETLQVCQLVGYGFVLRNEATSSELRFKP